MKKFYLFSFTTEIKVKHHGKRKEKILIVFYPYKKMAKQPNEIYNQLRTYFQFNILPDKIIVLGSSYNEDEILSLFEPESEVYDYIPLFTVDEKFDNISLNFLQKNGDIKNGKGFKMTDDFLNEVFNRGLVKIFHENGGLIVSQSAHHFVFPSGKHSDRFLRPGNVLLKGIHINFIVFALYRHLKGKQYVSIYCDTSSINSLAFAYINLLKEFDSSFLSSVQVESFGSYQGFENAKFSAPKDSLFLISSSTSGSIIKRMLEDKKQIIQVENICIIYGLEVEVSYRSRIICDLKLDEEVNPDGIKPFESYNVARGVTCKFCEDDSKPVEVKGDVFLLEKPSISGKLLSLQDYPTSLRNFYPYFKKGQEQQSIIKSFYKENSIDEKKYEVYIDTDTILNEWKNRNANHPFEKIFIKLEKHILQNIPASLKYLIPLSDNSSLLLTKIILSILEKRGIKLEEEAILSIKNTDIAKIVKEESGSIVIVSSSITTGRNLLFISRALREYEDNYQRIYFTFINRTSNKKHFEFLESNLSLGEFGKGTHKIINVENILCSHEAYNTPWHVEREFLKNFEEFCESREVSPEAIKFCTKRIDELNNSGATNGLSNNLFFPSISGNILKINKGFAFAPQGDFVKESTQADVYFIISTILNDLRCNGKLKQSEYVRNLLEPGNFVRFNDGIIQAAILRSAKNDELRYDLSEEMSLQIQGILEDMINHIDDEHAEGILEFFYGLAIKKLRITEKSLSVVIKLIESQEYLKKDSILKGLIEIIKNTYNI